MSGGAMARPARAACRLGGVAVLALAALSPGARAGAQAAPAPARPAPASVPTVGATRVGVELSHDTVTVGTPFVVSVRVRAPLGAQIAFPAGPDTSGVVQPLDPRAVMATGDTAAVDQTARYRLAAWDVGPQQIALGAVEVRAGAEVRRIVLDPLTVEVASVLPADSTERVPKAARPIYTFGKPWWLPWLLALLAAAIVGLLLWWWLRRRRRPQPVAVLDPLAEAERRFAQIDELHLVDAGERGRHVALSVEVVREYLARRLPAAAASLTSRELLHAIGRDRRVPADRLSALLHEADLVKFARRPVTADRARELGQESRAIVRAVHQATEPAAESTEAPPRRQLGSAA